MDADNLRTASLYINNQLLSRGLLRNGQTIDFARPHKSEEGLDVTMGKIMSVVNDLILRRDRDSQQRENLSQAIRALRADALRSTTDMERITTKNAELQRKVGIADATERALKTQLRSAEQAVKGLKEDMARMRVLVGQTRAQCANEVRKKERVIEGMKKHVAEGGRARGSGKAVGVATINVVPGVGGENGSGAGMGTDDEGYDLRMETNEFLTELARGLSGENESLGGLVRRTIETLRTVSGCEKEEEQEGNMVVQMEGSYEHLASEMEVVIEHLRTILTNPSFVSLEEVEVREEEITRLREGWEKMESRWKDAVQMMDGWRHRMARSGQTVNIEELKMGLSLSPFKPTAEPNYEVLQLSMVQEEDEEEDEDEGDTQADIDAMDDSGIGGHPEPEFHDEEELSDAESSIFEEEPEQTRQEEFEAEEEEEGEDEVEEEDYDEVAEEQQQPADMTLDTVSSLPGTPPQMSPLRETTKGNRGSPTKLSPKGFTTIIEENTWDLLQLEQSSYNHKSISTPTPKPLPRKETKEEAKQLFVASTDETSVPKTPAPTLSAHSSTRSSTRSSVVRETRSSAARAASAKKPAHQTPKPKATPKIQLQPPTSASRLPRPPHIPPQQSPLTMASIAAKLAASEREADAARVKAKLKAAKLARSAASTTSTTAPRSKSPIKKREPEVTKLMPPSSSPVREEPTKSESTSGRTMRSPEKDLSAVSNRKRKVRASRDKEHGRAARRRSTLSPWELESLILGGMGSPKKEE
ncbi:d1e81114-b461-49f9-ab54-fe189ed26e97 [Sclerotinia trifoliorum]|uniref:D1e81114-b461-49f9-ab54-fe189ed26e97 n=1 Tax=Sclerotinia trifoliorum TaxID=28548 RepID=A0A8H2VQU5_9HELO|nr:d1e81114-b461-49f9-ab54-fe189ed26e97 [Sclerotinia trifoliorum]